MKHPDGSFDYRVLHTPGYDESTGEHWCWNCHCQMVHHDDEWLCPKCGDHIDDPENKEEVLNAMERSFQARGAARLSGRK